MPNCFCHSDCRTQWTCVVCKPSKTSNQAVRSNIIRHYLSEKHRKSVAQLNSGGRAVREGVDHNQKLVLCTEQICQALIDDAIVTASRKSLPFTAIPLMLDHTARAFNAIVRDDLKAVDIAAVRKVSPEAANICIRLEAVTARENIKGGTRMACRRARASVANRLGVLAKKTRELKVKFLRRCRFLCLSADETDAWSLTSPLAVALQGCDPNFNWGNYYIGQKDVALTKTGEGCFNATKEVVQSVDDEFADLPDLLPAEDPRYDDEFTEDAPSLWDRVFFSCTDGASAMRSTPMYAGLDCYPEGISFVSHMKRDNKPLLGNVHCICHNWNLGLKEALKICVWSGMWIKHMRAVYNWFSKSPARKTKFANLSDEMELLGRVVTWKMVYPQYYCPTRWVGMCCALASIVGAADLHQEYCKHLIAKGFRPDRETTDPNLPADAVDARLDEEEENDDISAQRFHHRSFYQFNDVSPRPWDLPVDNIDGDVQILEGEELLRLDTGDMSNQFRDLPNGTGKKSKLLNEYIGMTDFNLGLDCMMLDALQPYKQLVERFQVQTGPIAHRACGWIIEFFDSVNEIFLGDTPTFGHHFNAWAAKHNSPEEGDMISQIKAMGRSFLFTLLRKVRYRIQPYWKFLMGLELINPCSSYEISAGAWEGITDLMVRVGWDQTQRNQAIKELKLQRRRSSRWSLAQIKLCKANLLRFYKDRITDSVQRKYPVADLLACIVFSIHMASAIIETFFSKTSYIKSKTRKNLSDKRVSQVLHVSQTPPPVDVERLPVNSISLDVTVAAKRQENDLDSLRNKYLDRKITREFNVNNRFTQYKGVVDQVYWEPEMRKFIFHVTYDDGDGEELELWQIRTFVT